MFEIDGICLGVLAAIFMLFGSRMRREGVEILLLV